MPDILAVVIGTVAAIILGMLWYGPLFGKTWMKLVGFTSKDLDEAKKKGMGKTYLINFISTLVLVYIFAYFIEITNMASLSASVGLAFLVWLGFIATITLSSVLWESKPLKLYVLNNLYNLITLIVVAIIINLF